LLKSGKNPSKILVTEKWLRKNQNLSKKFHDSLINIVSEEVLASAISTINPDGIAALVEISEIPNYQFNKKDDTIFVTNIDGPLNYLENNWKFVEQGDLTEVTFDVDFEIKNKFLNILMTKSFQFGLEKIADAFQKRAESL